MKPSCRACLLSGVSSQDSRICNGCNQDYRVQAEQPGSKKKHSMVSTTAFPPSNSQYNELCVPLTVEIDSRLFLNLVTLLASKHNKTAINCFFFKTTIIRAKRSNLLRDCCIILVDTSVIRQEVIFLWKCEPDKVRQMITATQNMTRWPPHPSVAHQ